MLRNTPLILLSRQHQRYWPAGHASTLSAHACQVKQILQHHGASFYDQVLSHTDLLPTQLESALAELAAAGHVTSDNFSGVRALIKPHKAKTSRYRQRLHVSHFESAGRWSLLPDTNRDADGMENTAGYYVRTLLRRYGVLFKRLYENETIPLTWRELHYELRRMEARGEIRGGRFVDGFSGEQFALPEAITPLRQHRDADSDSIYLINASDTLNLSGIIAGEIRVPARHTLHLVYRNGLPVAQINKGEIELLAKLKEADIWEIQNRYVRHINPAKYTTQKNPLPL